MTRKRSTSPSHPRSSGAIHRRVREEHSEETAQDYVKHIAALIEENGEARAIDLARQLGVTHVTVGRTIQRLQREGLVTTLPYRSIFLTEAGRDLAEKSHRRHSIVLRFLQSIGVPESIAQADAEGIEHHVSEETLAALIKIIGPNAANGDGTPVPNNDD